MSTLLDQVIDTAKRLSPDQQDEIAHIILAFMANTQAPEDIDPEHLPGVLEGLAQAERGEFATDAEVQAAFARFDRA